MDSPRSAIHAIKGYFYQFDKTIVELLYAQDDDDVIYVEGVEDIDLKNADEITAIQCKYYENTVYNHSVIAHPIRLMLTDYAKRLARKEDIYKYTLYGYYPSGHEKLALPLTIEYLKENFLTYNEFPMINKVKTKKTILVHEDLNIDDQQLTDFISLLKVDIHASSYDVQLKNIFTLLSGKFSCTEFEAECYYYNNAISKIKEIATKKDVANRKIIPSEFFSAIDNKNILFDLWFGVFRTEIEYCNKLKSELFPAVMNANNYDRFFLFEDNNCDVHDYIEIIAIIVKRWSNLRVSRTSKENRFSPYIYIKDMSPERHQILKRELARAGYPPMDGIDFLGDEFSTDSIMKDVNELSYYKVRFINNLEYLDDILNCSTRRKEIYQFYFHMPIYSYETSRGKVIKIQIKSLDMCKRILKNE
ncbi:hypothetical protein GP965_07695 [Escherichia coli]|uniref:Uncharacterized protein n=1 Tax=Escherichia coli TaxID=562 RepID=A0A8T5ZXD5_ECOLX|nr:DUF4297 family anti-phage-associated protein [Escherichia coli]MWT20814.1 hypothetical protein [Escherichia coli]MWU35183.1 hypothetical protein [Escherichia coli]